MSTVREIARAETAMFLPRVLLLRVLLAPLPRYVGNRTRALVMRLLGFRIGRGVLLCGLPVISGERGCHRNLTIGMQVFINVDCFFDLGARISIGEGAGLAQETMLLTTSHHLGGPGRRFEAPLVKPITIGRGAWIGARCTILPGVSIGDGAVVAAGSLVADDVAANTLVAGVPARPVKSLPDH